jgi:hypothetical protein
MSQIYYRHIGSQSLIESLYIRIRKMVSPNSFMTSAASALWGVLMRLCPFSEREGVATR